MVLKIVLCLLAGYLFGSFSTAWMVGKHNNVDLKQCGSGNLGMTNVLRTLGKKWAAVTLLGDFAKVILPLVFVRNIIFAGEDYCLLMVLYTGFGTVLGHCYPFWLHFKGGKGVAAMSAVMVVYDPLVAPVGLPIFLLIVLTTKYMSLGSLFVALLFPVWVTIRSHFIDPNPYYPHMIIVTLCYTVAVFIMHRGNIGRLIAGEERKIGEKK